MFCGFLQATLLCRAACTPAPTCPWATWIPPRSPSTLSTTHIKVSHCHQQYSWRQAAEFSVHTLSYPFLSMSGSRFCVEPFHLVRRRVVCCGPEPNLQPETGNIQLTGINFSILCNACAPPGCGCCRSYVGVRNCYIFLAGRHLNIFYANLCLCPVLCSESVSAALVVGL